jgi:UDP-glucose 4-epimerase
LCSAHEVAGFDRSPSSTVEYTGDIGDVDLLREALQGVDAVVHTAALHAPQVGFLSDAEFKRINVDATRGLAEMAIEAGVSQIVFTSTTALYGSASRNPQAAVWVDEQLKPQPKTIYHSSKLAAERLLETVANENEIAVTVLRMSRCFPEPAPLMAAYRLHRGIDARDVADAHALALQKKLPGFQKFVISGATPFRPGDTEELKSDAAPVLARRAPELVEAFEQRRWRLPETIDRIYSPALAMERLSWQPKYGFMEVIKMLDESSSEVLPPRRYLAGQGKDPSVDG